MGRNRLERGILGWGHSKLRSRGRRTDAREAAGSPSLVRRPAESPTVAGLYRTNLPSSQSTRSETEFVRRGKKTLEDSLFGASCWTGSSFPSSLVCPSKTYLDPEGLKAYTNTVSEDDSQRKTTDLIVPRAERKVFKQFHRSHFMGDHKSLVNGGRYGCLSGPWP